MSGTKTATLPAGARVRVRAPGPVPEWSTWDDDGQRSSTQVKKRLQQLFFRGDKRVRGEIVYVANESLRQRLKSKNQVKVQLRDPAGATIVILADATNLITNAA
ncbi:MAG: hypothetical protein AB1716_13510 [Planctomycetota bacterium]